jgi:putative toxin-antitoxin system antitoxin component (TIGR02293 family)
MGSSRQYTRREQVTFLQYLQYRLQQRIDGIRRAPAARLFELARVLGVSRGTLFAFLGISRASMNRRVQAHLPLSADESDLVQGIESLIWQVQAMVEDGVPAETAGFDAARWIGHWLCHPLPALGWRRPASYLHTLDGQRLVRKMLGMIAGGVYA